MPVGPPGPTPSKGVIMAALTRRQDDKMIAGVCSGLADRFGVGANVVRLLFVLSCLLPGPQFVLYLALWVVMPPRR